MSYCLGGAYLISVIDFYFSAPLVAAAQSVVPFLSFHHFVRVEEKAFKNNTGLQGHKTTPNHASDF